MKMKIAIADCNALGHIVKHSTKELSFRGEKTGVIFGFLRKLFVIQEKIKADAYVFCWDSPYGYERELVYPEYKANREEKPPLDVKLNEIALPQFQRLRDEVLPSIGFANIFMSAGLEADDLIAQVAIDYKALHDIIILSRDGDLFQLLDGERVTMFNPVSMKYYNEDALVREYGITPNNWNMVKAIAGCDGDNVKGVDGVAEKTAAKFLLGIMKPGKTMDKIIAAEETVVSNLRLVTLPWETTSTLTLEADRMDVDGFVQMCKEFGMRSLLDTNTYEKYRSMINEQLIQKPIKRIR